MIKHYCDNCGFEIPMGGVVSIAMRVRRGSKNLDENFSTCGNDVVKDYCVECAKNIIGEETIKANVAARLERLARAEERRKEKEQKNDKADT